MSCGQTQGFLVDQRAFHRRTRWTSSSIPRSRRVSRVFFAGPRTRGSPSKLIAVTYEFSEIELRRLDLNLPLVFSAVMRERGVAGASKRLHIGPSAVSMALARLRDAVGDDLFVRAARGMEPTPRAEAQWAELGPALSRIEAAARGAKRFDPGTAEAVFRFAAPDDLEFVLVLLLLERLGRDAPGVRLVVRPSDFRTLLGRLDSGDADLALSATPGRGVERRHRVRPLHRETFAVLFDPSRVGARAPISLDDYVGTPHLLLSPSGDGAWPPSGASAGCSPRCPISRPCPSC